jgi:hypothetical protein
MAYGVASHTFRDYFHMSNTMARSCCVQFDDAVRSIYSKEYLRHPSREDIVSINKLHKSIHFFDGLFGSLDCMHTYWKNCPMGWQGSFKGKEKKPSIVLEAICDYNMWFWHAAYGYAGTMNDLTILALSEFMSKLVDGSFSESESKVVPYQIGSEVFDAMYILVDGIYPQYTRFVKGLSEPVGSSEKKFTKWQHACRKDIERAFALLQGKWQCLARPMHQIDMGLIGSRVAACLILHNMCVSDRIMDDVYATYDPSGSIVDGDCILEYDEEVIQPQDLQENQGMTPPEDWSLIGNNDPDLVAELTRAERWGNMQNLDEFNRLHIALMESVSALTPEQWSKRKKHANAI